MSRPIYDALERLELFEKRLREFLAMIANENASTASVDRSWRACRDCECDLNQLGALLEPASEDEKTQASLRLASIRCLNAIAVLELTRQRTSIAESLQRTRATRGSFAYYAPGAHLGSSCDIAG